MYDFANPTSEMINFEDITHHLSKEQRFANMLDDEWSVLQHVLLVRKLVEHKQGDTLQQFIALHHDDFEAYGRDIPTPLKNLLPNYKIIEKKGNKAISNVLGVNLTNMPDIVHECDSLTVKIEDYLFSRTDSDWHDMRRSKLMVIDKHFDIITYITRLMNCDKSQHIEDYYNWHLKLKRFVQNDSR